MLVVAGGPGRGIAESSGLLNGPQDAPWQLPQKQWISLPTSARAVSTHAMKPPPVRHRLTQN